MKKIIFFTLCLFLIVAHCYGQDSLQQSGQIVDSVGSNNRSKAYSMPSLTNATKTQGDSAYMNNDYNSAIQIYESLLSKGESADVYYNLGNSYYKAGNIAKAILNYERALLLEPGNSDIRVNLDIARSKTLDKVEIAPEIFFITWINAIINATSADGWAIWGIISFILLIVGLYLFFFSRKVILKKIGFLSGIAFLILTICSNVFASKQKERLLNRNFSIVIDPSVTVRSTPSESGTSLFILHEGSKVFMKDNSMKDWKEIKLEDGKVGWVPASAIEVI